MHLLFITYMLESCEHGSRQLIHSGSAETDHLHLLVCLVYHVIRCIQFVATRHILCHINDARVVIDCILFKLALHC